MKELVIIETQLLEIKVAIKERDDEAAHSKQDALYVWVLTAIADGAENPKVLAHKALEAERLKFSRWCA